MSLTISSVFFLIVCVVFVSRYCGTDIQSYLQTYIETPTFIYNKDALNITHTLTYNVHNKSFEYHPLIDVLFVTKTLKINDRYHE